MLLAVIASQASFVAGTPATPIITSANSFDVVDGATLSHTLTASEAVTWAITGGVDADEFQVVGDELQWDSDGTRSVASPQDDDADNAYEVEVTATGAGGPTSQNITATVVENWVIAYDATTGSFGGGEVDWSDENTRLMIDPASILVGSSGFTKIRVRFIAGSTGALDIQNAAFGEATADDALDDLVDMINYSGTPTVLTFDSGSPGKSISAGTEFTSDAVTLVTPFDAAHYLIVAINHGPASKMRGREETNALIASRTMSGDDTTTTSDVSGDYIADDIHRSYGVSKIELMA